ncbi:MAG: protein tyrosine phosphatase [Isosphaeraceae bacterium]
MQGQRTGGRLRILWPWLVLALAMVPAIWYVLDYESDIDPEFPRVVRPTFNTYPPPAYRFAEPGDTIDHIAVYVASAGLVISAWGLFRGIKKRLWMAALALSLAGFWHAATPGPLLDGWHGLGWRVILDTSAPWMLRLGIATLAVGLALLTFRGLAGCSIANCWRDARVTGIAGLLATAALLVVLRQVGWVDREPLGFWPRWIFVWGLLAWALALLRVAPKGLPNWRRSAIIAGLFLAWLALDFTGRGIFWYQRPLHRLRAVVPGRLYISAMPTYDGLALAQTRHHFRTVINLFPEYTPERSHLLPDELRFVRDHGLCYVGNEQDDDPSGGQFIARTLAVAQDPAAWPVLVHCHASMDRSPAWMGLYRYVVQGWPLVDALREIEHHRGLRPKASVTLLYNRVLPLLAPERAAQDPTLALLRRCAQGTDDPALGLMSPPDGDAGAKKEARNGTPAQRR